MKLLILATLCGVALAGAVAWSIDAAHGSSGSPGSMGPVGIGVLVGSTAGLAIATGGAAWQARLLARGSRHVLNAFVVIFLVKLVTVVAGTIVLHATAAEWIDWRAYLLSFPCGVLWITGYSVLASALSLRHRSA